MSTLVSQRATLNDLIKVKGKSELIGGRIVTYMASGFLPGMIAVNILIALRAYVRAQGLGHVTADNVGYAVDELHSGRESFCPDVGFFTGPPPANAMRFVDGSPAFAVEVRSENDYGKPAERDLADKRADYFAAGTLVVWDVDPVNERVTSYRLDNTSAPQLFRKGDVANAEPAVAGWAMSVDQIFAE